MEIDELKQLWDGGGAAQVGAVLYEALPNDLRPAWAAEILALCGRELPRVPAVEAVLVIARNAGRWGEGHAAFRKVRELTLAEERSRRNGTAYEALLFVAENAAKVVYNASGPPDPFDHDSGYWLVLCLRQFADQLGGEYFRGEAWRLLETWWRRTQDPRGFAARSFRSASD